MIDEVEKALLSIPCFSLLRFKDEKLIKSAFPKDTIKYSLSFLYLLRASHDDKGNLGYKYITPDVTAVIGYRNKRIYVTPLIDHTGGIALKQLCDQIIAKTHCEIFLKKFSQENYPKLKQARNTPILPGVLEDDTCPETILKLSTLFVTLEGDINPLARKFIKKIKRFEKFNMNFEIIDNIKGIPEQQIKKFLMKDPDKYANYLPIIKYLYSHEENVYDKVLIFKLNKEIRGLYIGELFSLVRMGLYCGVTAKSIPGETEWMDLYYFKKLLTEGIRTIYLGGSETRGVMQYVEKLLPSSPDYFVKTVPYENFLDNKDVNSDFMTKAKENSGFKPLPLASSVH